MDLQRSGWGFIWFHVVLNHKKNYHQSQGMNHLVQESFSMQHKKTLLEAMVQYTYV